MCEQSCSRLPQPFWVNFFLLRALAMRKLYWSYKTNERGGRVKVELPGSRSLSLVMPTLTCLWDGCATRGKRTAEVIAVEDSPCQKRNCPDDTGVAPHSKGRQTLANNASDVLDKSRGTPGEALPENQRKEDICRTFGRAWIGCPGRSSC